METTVERIRALWRDLTDAPNGFHETPTLVRSDQHRSAPPGWVGVVRIGDVTVITSPSHCFDRVRDWLEGVDPTHPEDHFGIVSALQPAKRSAPPASSTRRLSNVTDPQVPARSWHRCRPTTSESRTFSRMQPQPNAMSLAWKDAPRGCTSYSTPAVGQRRSADGHDGRTTSPTSEC